MARLQLDLSETHDEIITELMQMCDLRTKKDVIENALMLLGWAAKEASNGLTIAAVDEGNGIYREVETPALFGARQKGRRTHEGHPLPPAQGLFGARQKEERPLPAAQPSVQPAAPAQRRRVATTST
jgi:hypothetical protein